MRPDGLPFARVALVLQGGGALGAYQAGVYQGLGEAGIRADWIAGVSIGALNAALVAGNPPERRVERLHEFWDTICRPAFFRPVAGAVEAAIDPLGVNARKAFNAFNAWRAMVEGQQGFFVPRGLQSWWLQNVPPGEASFYDTSPLKATLEKLVDFDRLNSGETRVSVMAVNAHTGNLEVFDNGGSQRRRLHPEHFMASAALPPGFPPVEVGGAYFWDGGLVSNTPLSLVLDGDRCDTLAFQVDLWSARGPLPTNVYDAQERAKDVQYSSRTRLITDQIAREQAERKLLRELLERVPTAKRRSDPVCQEAARRSTDHRFTVIHLIYQEKEWDGVSKDYEFGPLTMRNHWESGLEDVRRSLAHKHWLALPPEDRPFVTHDIHRAKGG